MRNDTFRSVPPTSRCLQLCNRRESPVTFDVLNTSLDALRSAADGVAAEQRGQPTPCSEWTVGQVLMHAAGDQHAWAATVGSAEMPTYNHLAPPQDAAGVTAAARRAGGASA